MGKFGCRLYCWGCGGCCFITGIVMGILAGSMPPGMVASLQEGLFDLSYIDDTSQTEAEGLLADAGAPIAESDAFKAWGKTISEGFDDCMKADFAFDWGKTPADCVDGLHPTFFMWNATSLDTWGAGGSPLQVQELSGVAFLKDITKIEVDAAHWDSTGKARFRIVDSYAKTGKCSSLCEEEGTAEVAAFNMIYGMGCMGGTGDGWVIMNAKKDSWNSQSDTLKNYLAATDADPSPRAADFQTFIENTNAAKLGTISLAMNEYLGLKNFLWDEAGKLLTAQAPTYGVPANVVPIFQNQQPYAMLGWDGAGWKDHISQSPFTFNFVGGKENKVNFGGAPSGFIEEQMSSAFYHEGLGYVTQHFEMFGGSTTNTHSCAWDPDCTAECTIDGAADCVPNIAKGYDGGKIPGLYFFSPKGGGAAEEFDNFVTTFYLVITMKTDGRAVIPANYKGPDNEKGWDFSGYVVHSTFKARSFYRRLENCNYPGGRPLGDGKDSVGKDCNAVKDTSMLEPFFGLPVYWTVIIRKDAGPGWDPEFANAEGGAGQISMWKQVNRVSCVGMKFCSDEMVNAKGAAFTNFLHYGYEPHLGALVDVSFVGGLAFKWTPTVRHALGTDGYQMMPLFWFWNYLHLPGAINMDLAKLQTVPGALNGFYTFLLGQCMISLIGGFACCFCGV